MSDNTKIAAPKDKKPDLISGVELVRIDEGGVSPPCASYNGKPPKKGDLISFKLSNQVIYTGKVADAVESDGNVLVEFVDGIHPVAPGPSNNPTPALVLDKPLKPKLV